MEKTPEELIKELHIQIALQKASLGLLHSMFITYLTSIDHTMAKKYQDLYDANLVKFAIAILSSNGLNEGLTELQVREFLKSIPGIKLP